MKVKELRQILELVDGECTILIIDQHHLASDVRAAEIDPYFDFVLDERSDTAFCIKTY